MADVVEISNNQQWNKILSEVDTILFDCDGVLWVGENECISGAQNVIKDLKEKGKKIAFVSNNSSKSRKKYLEKFEQLNFFGVEADNIFSTAYVAALYLKHTMNLTGKVYLIGTTSFEEELRSNGIETVGVGPDPVEGTLTDWQAMAPDPDVKAVVVGFDPFFSYMKMMKAASYITKQGCPFVATNLDPALPLKEGCQVLVPGTGTFVMAVRHSVQKDPDIILGKPCKPMFDAIQQVTKLDPGRTLMVGDRLTTDIVFGNTFGMKTLAVLSGIASREDVLSAKDTCRPQYITTSLSTYHVNQ